MIERPLKIALQRHHAELFQVAICTIKKRYILEYITYIATGRQKNAVAFDCTNIIQKLRGTFQSEVEIWQRKGFFRTIIGSNAEI